VSLGSLTLKVKAKYQHGLGTAYYRDIVRHRLLQTPAITQTIDRTCEIHVLTSAADWLNLLWALKSFYHYSQRQYALCIHDDGTLTAKHQQILQHHFPNARLIDRLQADQYVLESLKDYPRCLELRRTNKLALKVFDFAAYLESDRMLLLDSDILFFAEPIELLQRIEDSSYLLNTVNGDVASAYTIDPQVVKERLEFEVIDRFNSGLGLIHKASMQLDWIEEFLTLPDIIGHFWRIEQTLYALFSSRFGVELLPPAYSVHLTGEINGSSCRHYVGKIRHLMYDEGIRQLMTQKFLTALG
jgi:alpha-N-acetylglucosamine transferase